MRKLNENYFAVVEGEQVIWGPYPLPYRAPNGMRTKGYIDPLDHQTLLDQANLRPVYDEDRIDPLDEDLFLDVDREVYYDAREGQVVRRFIYEHVPGFRSKLERKMNHKVHLRRLQQAGDLPSTLLAEYQETEKEAREFLNMTNAEKDNASEDDWPALAAGIGPDADNLEKVSQLVVQQAMNLRDILQITRSIRKEAIEKIRDAITDDDALEIYEDRVPEFNKQAMNIL